MQSMNDCSFTDIVKIKCSQVLPSWELTMAGSVSFKLRTTETDGLVMYNPGAGGTVSALTLIWAQILRKTENTFLSLDLIY